MFNALLSTRGANEDVASATVPKSSTAARSAAKNVRSCSDSCRRASRAGASERGPWAASTFTPAEQWRSTAIAISATKFGFWTDFGAYGVEILEQCHKIGARAERAVETPKPGARSAFELGSMFSSISGSEPVLEPCVWLRSFWEFELRNHKGIQNYNAGTDLLYIKQK